MPRAYFRSPSPPYDFASLWGNDGHQTIHLRLVRGDNKSSPRKGPYLVCHVGCQAMSRYDLTGWLVDAVQIRRFAYAILKNVAAKKKTVGTLRLRVASTVRTARLRSAGR